MSFTRILIASTVMILTMFCLRYLSHAENVKPNKPFSSFPKQIGEWVGREARFDERIYAKLGVDDSFLGHYRTSDGHQVELYIGFYQSQREGDLIHSPKNCMPGAGWNIVSTSVEKITIPNNKPQKIKVIKLTLRKGSKRRVALYWFQSRGRFISSEYMQKIYLVIDSITRHRTDGSFVRLISSVIDGDERKTENDLKDFAKLLIPILQEYIPS